MNTIVRNYLIELARKRTNQTATYQKLSDDCKLGFDFQHNPYQRKEVGAILDSISRHEHSNSRPLLSSLILRASDNTEGEGFYKLAEELGFGKSKDLKENGVFDAMQIKECITFWSNDEKYELNK